MNRLVVAAASAAVVFCSCDVRAKTVALWPLNNGNIRCAIDPRNDFTASSLVTYSADQTIGWNLPPNADSNVTDAATYLFDPVNRGEVIYDYNKALLDAKSEHLWSLLDVGPGKQFTLEGYFKLSALIPETQVKTKIIANVNGGTANPNGGWSLNYYTKLNDETYHIFRMEGNGWQLNFGSITDDEVVGLTNGWNHFAVVFNYQSATVANSSDWTVYFNGRSLGTKQKRLNFAPERNYASIRIGQHLSANDDRTAYGRFCYWRLSDTALAPSEFLNYDPEGKGGTLVPEPPPVQPERTVAYWKFNSVNGVADVRDSVGQAHLLSLVAANRGSTAVTDLMCPSEDCAFVGNPPNKTVTFPDGNHGSFYVPSTRIANVCITQQDLGATLDIDKSFTVEGWIKPRRRTGSDYNASQAWMFGNMPGANYSGWLMGMLMSGGRRYLGVYAYNFVGSKKLIVDANSCAFCDVTDWGEDWRHLALTYDRTGGEEGFGEWKLYMNGVLQGTVANVVSPQAADAGKAATKFYIGGTYNGAFAGCYDAVRVSQGVLTPKQFLCYGGDDAEEATGVLATWPLNVKAGTGLGGANLEGGYNLFNRDTDFPEGFYLTTTDDEDAPNATIPNPDQSLAFDGGAQARSANAGSIRFHGGNNQDYAWLATGDSTVMETINSADGWTLEGWAKYDATTGSPSWTHCGDLFVLATDISQSSCPYRLAVWNKSGYTGRVPYQTGDPFGTMAETSVPALPQLTAKKWYHVAVEHSYFMDESGAEPVKMSRMSYYLDGVLHTNIDLVAKSTASTIKYLVFGSNMNGSHGWPGFVNSWRLSRGQLDPSEFLCAAAETPVPPETEKKALAYWPLDRNEDGSLNIETKAGVPGYALSVADSVSATNGDIVASTARARGRVPNKSVPFDRANIGSLATDGAYLRADYLGARLDLNAAWTVEGWIRPDATAAGTRTIAGTYVETLSPYGWKLMMTPGAAEPAFSLRAQPAGCTPMAEGTFVRAANSTAAWVDGGWNHLALEFDPNEGCGTWTLYLNGQAYGSIENSWRNLTLKAKGTFFQFGTYQDDATPSFFGGYDIWRVSTGLLTPEEMLYRDQLGLMLFLR